MFFLPKGPDLAASLDMSLISHSEPGPQHEVHPYRGGQVDDQTPLGRDSLDEANDGKEHNPEINAYVAKSLNFPTYLR
jgi:hypothetical protein